MEKWNGRSMLQAMVRSPPVAIITTNASGTWGCGAFSNEGAWFQLEWPPSWQSFHIAIKELLPVVAVVATWGRKWQGHTILARTDNAAVVAIIRSGPAKPMLIWSWCETCFFFYFRAFQ